jgi:hypothetical protein
MDYMNLGLRRAIRWITLGLGAVSLQAGAEVAASKGSLSTTIADGAVQAVDLFALKWGWLIGIVLIALVVVTRNRRAP